MVNRKEGQRDKERGSGFKYEKRDPKKMRERAEQTGGMFDSIFKNGVTSWRPAQGDNIIRILPPTFKDADHYGLDIWVHERIGADKSTYLCPKKMKGDNCPICDAAAEAKKDGEEEDGKKMSAKKRIVVWMLDREGDDPEEPVAFSMSWTMDRDIAALCNDKKTGAVLELDNPDKGFDVMFKRTGKDLNTRYVGMRIDRDDSPILEKERDQRAVLELIEDKPLDTILKFYDEEYLAKVVDGTVEKSDDDDDKGERGRGRGRDRDDDESDSRRGRDKGDDDEGTSRRRNRDDDDDKSSRRSRDKDDEGDKDEGRSRRRGRDDEGDDDKPSRRNRDDDKGDKDGKDDDDRGSRRSRRDADEGDDDRSSRRSRRDADEGDDKGKDDDDRGSRRSRDKDDADDDRGSRRSRRDKDDADDDKGRRRRDDPEDDPADDDAKDPEDDAPRRRRGGDDDDDKGGRVRRK